MCISAKLCHRTSHDESLSVFFLFICCCLFYFDVTTTLSRPKRIRLWLLCQTNTSHMSDLPHNHITFGFTLHQAKHITWLYKSKRAINDRQQNRNRFHAYIIIYIYIWSGRILCILQVILLYIYNFIYGSIHAKSANKPWWFRYFFFNMLILTKKLTNSFFIVNFYFEP